MKYASLMLAGLGLLLGGAEQAKADLLWVLNDTTNGVSGSVNFVKVAGEFEIQVLNTETNTADAGHAISQIQFTVGGSLGLPTAFTELKGTETDFSNPAVSVDYKPPTNAQHWPFSTSGSTVSLFDVGGSIGGQPNHLIVAPGSTPNASLTNTHLPSFIGETDFFFADATVPANFTTADITSVKLAFGTTPEVPLENLTPQISSVPEPASILLFGAALTITARRLRRKSI